MCTEIENVLKCVLVKICVLKLCSSQNMRTQDAYLNESVYLKRVPKIKVKVMLNWSKSRKISMNVRNLPLQPCV